MHYYKLLILSCIPVYAFASGVLFRKAGMNFAEHIVLNAYMQGGVLLINIMVICICILLFKLTGNWKLVTIAMLALSLFTTIYTIRFYTKYFSPWYKNKFLLRYRAMGVIFLAGAIIGLIGGTVVYLQMITAG